MIETRFDYARWLARKVWEVGVREVMKDRHADIYARTGAANPQYSEEEFDDLFIEGMAQAYMLEDDRSAIELMTGLTTGDAKLLGIMLMQRVVFKMFPTDADVKGDFGEANGSD